MSLKMERLAEYTAETDPEMKPEISGQVGAQHYGLEGFLALPKSAKLQILGVLPTEVLNRVIDENGGLTLFCTTLAYDPTTKDMRGYNRGLYLLDQEMYDFLAGRLELND